MQNKTMYLICSSSTGMYVMPVHIEKETADCFILKERVPDIKKSHLGRILFENQEVAEQRIDQILPPDENRNDRADRIINRIGE